MIMNMMMLSAKKKVFLLQFVTYKMPLLKEEKRNKWYQKETTSQVITRTLL